MVERGGGNLLERLGPDLSAVILMCLEDPADLVRSASVSHSWRRFVIANGFCKKLCLRMTPEISYFVRAIEVGGLSNNMESGPNFSVQWQILESEHRIYAYLGYCILSPRFFQEFLLEAITISSTVDRMDNMAPSNIGTNMSSSYSTSQGYSLRTFKLNSKLCVVHEIRIQSEKAIFHYDTLAYKSRSLRFRLGHMWDENANSEESPAENYSWTYFSPEFSLAEAGNVQSIKLSRPVICICGILQIELFAGVQKSPSDKLWYISASQIEAVGYPLAPAFDVTILDRMGNSVLMYFPGVVGNYHRAGYSRNKHIKAERRRNRRSMIHRTTRGERSVFKNFG